MHRFGNRIPRHVLVAIRKEIELLEKLVADLEAICTSPFPLEKLLARSQPTAPILEEWRLAFRPAVCLEGFSTGHPDLPGDRRPIVTSEIYLLSEELGLARTLSRFFRLGRPFNILAKDS